MMIDKELSFDLPVPWKEKRFTTPQIGAINFLVGPNGSGKSKFAVALHSHLGNARILGTDRLSGMEQTSAFRNIVGDHFRDGLPKNQFGNYKNAGQQGLGIDTLVLLEERLDLRIQVEATLSHLFNRKIILEWNSGNLTARAMIGETGDYYRVDRDECHGIKELLVLLTHLYNNEQPYLIIDEPELNLHPQYQAFFMQEVRKMAGDPNADTKKKIVFVVTHSPFILDFRSIDDVKSVVSFNLGHSLPRHIFDLEPSATARLCTLVPRLNVHHKQLFFSDNPIFVEGPLDAQIVGTMQEARGVSVAGAGSCIIDARGCEEVNHYLDLCVAFGKQAYFLYDLDSLFAGNLRKCVKDDGSVQSFLLAAGVGGDFAKYCGELDRLLTSAIKQLTAVDPIPSQVVGLVEFLKTLKTKEELSEKKRSAKERVAVLTAISRSREGVVAVLTPTVVQEIEGRLAKIVSALEAKHVILLPGGTLERYLPEYTGDHYKITEEAKKTAVEREIAELARSMTELELASRYGELYKAVCALPSKVNVDVDRVLRDYLGHFIFELQAAVANNPTWRLDEVRLHLKTSQQTSANVFSIRSLERGALKEFSAVVEIAEMLGQGLRLVHVNQRTNAGMGGFEIEAT